MTVVGWWVGGLMGRGEGVDYDGEELTLRHGQRAQLAELGAAMVDGWRRRICNPTMPVPHTQARAKTCEVKDGMAAWEEEPAPLRPPTPTLTCETGG